MALDEETRASIEAFKKAMRDKSTKVHSSLTDAIRKSCYVVERNAKLSMKNAVISTEVVYRRGMVLHWPSIPWSAPAIDTGRLVQSITHYVAVDGSGIYGRVGTNVIYGSYLETGTSKMGPRPWLQPALEKSSEKIHELIGAAVSGQDVSIEVEGGE